MVVLWYVGSRTSSQLIGSTDAWHVYSQTAGRTVSGTDTAGNTYSYGSSRAPIFYDLDNTGYYVNPNSFSKLNRLQIAARNDNYYVGTVNATIIKVTGRI